ncbi:MAG TPA: DUF4139 domain-containing protein [Flavobacteriales bacterium]
MSNRILLICSAFFSFLLSFPAHAADGEKTVPSRITEAKVFMQGAQVTRSASATVPAGTSKLVFIGLAQGLDPQSIQVTGKGGYTILSVNHRINHLSESPKKKELAELMDRLKKLQKDHAYEKAMQDVWVNEEQLLNKNSSIGGQQNGITAAQLTAVNDYVRERLRITKSNWLAQQEKLNALQEEMGKVQQQMNELQALVPRPTSEVVVEISSSTEVAATFLLGYFVGNAGWTPAYDLRAKGVGQPIELLMKAQVVNNTGEDWEKVELGLSSGNPTLGGVMPTLSPWTLYTYRPRPTGHRSRAKAYESGRYDQAEGAMEDRLVSFKPAMAEVAAFNTVGNVISDRATTVEFNITTPFNVPSDGLPHTIGVQEHSIKATYQHYATPKLDKDAFLYARTTGWEDLSLLSGEANVFFEGTFVGQSFLELEVPKDTLDISLGRDKGVVVERVKRKTTDDKAAIGGKRTVGIGWDITARNTKGTAVDLEIRDQYPLSPQSEVEVKLEEKGGAVADEQKGLLTWKLKLAPKETKKVGFAYTVKHPKDMPMVLE